MTDAENLPDPNDAEAKLAEDYLARFEYPLGPDIPTLKISGPEVARWMRALKLFDDEAIHGALKMMRDRGEGSTCLMGNRSSAELQFSVYYLFRFHGVNGKVCARGHLFFPQTELMRGVAATTLEMLYQNFN